jgi:hypothetical protein
VRWPLATSDRNAARAGKRLRLALCGLLAAAQLLAFSHVALVAHRICAMHGEVVHAGAVAAPARHHAAHSATTSAQTDPSEHQHDHCLVMAGARERYVTPLASGADSPALAHTLPHTPSFCAGPVLRRALWPLAPKNSPPTG